GAPYVGPAVPSSSWPGLSGRSAPGSTGHRRARMTGPEDETPATHRPVPGGPWCRGRRSVDPRACRPDNPHHEGRGPARSPGQDPAYDTLAPRPEPPAGSSFGTRRPEVVETIRAKLAALGYASAD